LHITLKKQFLLEKLPAECLVFVAFAYKQISTVVERKNDRHQNIHHNHLISVMEDIYAMTSPLKSHPRPANEAFSEAKETHIQ